MDPLISTVAACFIAWLFGSAGWQKLSHGSYYAEVLVNYAPLLGRGALPATISLGSLELLIAVVIVVPGTRQYAALIAVALLAVYLVAMAWQLVRGKADMDCGCAGPANRQTISAWLLIRNSLLMMIAGLASLPVLMRGLTPADFGFILLATIFSILTYTCFEQLTANRPKLSTLRS